MDSDKDTDERKGKVRRKRESSKRRRSDVCLFNGSLRKTFTVTISPPPCLFRVPMTTVMLTQHPREEQRRGRKKRRGFLRPPATGKNPKAAMAVILNPPSFWSPRRGGKGGGARGTPHLLWPALALRRAVGGDLWGKRSREEARSK